MPDIYFYEAFAEEKELLQQYLPATITAEFTPHTIAEAQHQEPLAKLISIRTQSRIPPHWRTPVISRSTGFDHLDDYPLKAPCGYLPLYCNRAVAEQAMILWMNLLRKMPAQVQHFHTFNRDHLTGWEAPGKKIVVFGVGKIGYEIIKLAKALDMDAYGVDIFQNYPDVRYLTPEDGIKTADIIVCAMNLFANNKNYFNYDFLKLAKKGVFFINISRGELSPTSDILRLLKEGHFGGVGLDVFDQEVSIATSLRASDTPELQEITALAELQKHHNVILTPHNSFNTQEAVMRKCQQSVQQAEHFLERGEFLWKVPVLSYS